MRDQYQLTRRGWCFLSQRCCPLPVLSMCLDDRSWVHAYLLCNAARVTCIWAYPWQSIVLRQLEDEGGDHQSEKLLVEDCLHSMQIVRQGAKHCILGLLCFVKSWIKLISTYTLSHWNQWPRKFMFRHQNHVSMMLIEAEILPDFRKKQLPFWKSKMAAIQCLGKRGNIVFQLQ